VGDWAYEAMDRVVKVIKAMRRAEVDGTRQAKIRAKGPKRWSAGGRLSAHDPRSPGRGSPRLRWGRAGRSGVWTDLTTHTADIE